MLSHPFSHPGHPEHVQRLATYWAEVFGGPPKFSQECGGHSAMLYLHSSTGADDDLGERFVRAFNAAAQDADLPADPGFRAALGLHGVGGCRSDGRLAPGVGPCRRPAYAALGLGRPGQACGLTPFSLGRYRP